MASPAQAHVALAFMASTVPEVGRRQNSAAVFSVNRITGMEYTAPAKMPLGFMEQVGQIISQENLLAT
jgi:hypothetical protein